MLIEDIRPGNVTDVYHAKFYPYLQVNYNCRLIVFNYKYN